MMHVVEGSKAWHKLLNFSQTFAKKSLNEIFTYLSAHELRIFCMLRRSENCHPHTNYSVVCNCLIERGSKHDFPLLAWRKSETLQRMAPWCTLQAWQATWQPASVISYITLQRGTLSHLTARNAPMLNFIAFIRCDVTHMSNDMCLCLLGRMVWLIGAVTSRG
jgi:hypothetical protein